MALTTPLQFYAAATSVGGDAVATVMIPVAGRISMLHVGGRFAAGCLTVRLEISLQSTNQFTTNDARNVLFSFAGDLGSSQMLQSPAWLPMDVPVTEMDRIYLHYAGTSAAWLIVGGVWLRH